MDHKTLEAKVVVLGSQGVGKTSLVIRFVGNMFSQTVSPTIGASFFTYKITLGNYRIKLQVWDTAGQERFRSMAPMYYRNANAALLMYDITSLDSYVDMKSWIKELRRNVESSLLITIIGNKSDLKSERTVTTAEATDFAFSINASFYETSALNNIGVEETFLELGKQLIKMYEANPHCGLVPQGLYAPSMDPSDDANNASLSKTTLHNESTSSKGCGC